MPDLPRRVGRRYVLHLATPDPEAHAVRHLGPGFAKLEADGRIGRWHFARGPHRWTLTCDGGPASVLPAAGAEREVLDLCTATGMLAHWALTDHNPPTYTAGGAAALPAAEHWLHQDSCGALAYLRAVHNGDFPDQRAEMCLLLGTAAMWGAGLDRAAIAETWEMVAASAAAQLPPTADDAVRSVRFLLAADTGATAGLLNGQLGHAALWLASHTRWITAHADYGRALAHLASEGQLWHGVSAVLAAQLVGHADRLGVTDPSRPATAAAAAVKKQAAPR